MLRKRHSPEEIVTKLRLGGTGCRRRGAALARRPARSG
jgi:hypothetical protein